jgi:hypothetical protein
MKDEVDEAREMAARYMVRNEKLEAEIVALKARLAEAEAEARAEGIAEARRQERAAQKEFEEADEKKMTRLRNDADMWKQSHEGQVRNTLAFQADLEAMTAQRDAALASLRAAEEERDRQIGYVRECHRGMATMETSLAEVVSGRFDGDILVDACEGAVREFAEWLITQPSDCQRMRPVSDLIARFLASEHIPDAGKKEHGK